MPRLQMKWFKSDSKSIYILIIAYFMLYGICVFGNISSVEFMGIDEHSIIDSINGLTSHSYYNMNANYHSQYYGWTYFSLNFFIVGIAKVLGVSEPSSINLLIRVTHFIIGGLCTLSIFVLSRKLFSTFWSLAFTLIFITNPMMAHFINEIHPESIGILFQALAVISLAEVHKKKMIESKSFIVSILFLSLSSFSKQAFLISNFFVGIVFLICYYDLLVSKERKIFERTLWISILRATITFFVVFFFIHPYAFFQPEKFISAQAYISAEHSSKSFSEVFPAWIDTLSQNPIIVMNFGLLLLVPFLYKKNKLLSLSILLSNVISFIYIYKARLWITDTYLLPVFLFSFANVFYIFYRILSTKANFLIFTFKSVMILFATLIIIHNLSYSVFKEHSRFFLDGLKTKNLSWNYLENLSTKTKVAYSPNIAMPDNLKNTACHAWQGCSDALSLKKYNPDIIVLSPDYPHYNSSEYQKHIINNSYVEVAKFKKEPLVRTICNKPEFSISQYIFDISLVIESTKNCFIAYSEMIDDYSNHRIIYGYSISIYSK